MKKSFLKFKTIVAVVLAMVMMTMPVCAEEAITPYFNNINNVSLTIAFDVDNVAHCILSVSTLSHGSGVSGLMKLFDSDGTCLEIWSVSDYEQPIIEENTYQCTYGETYTVTFEGYAYSNNNTAPDRLEISSTATCKK